MVEEASVTSQHVSDITEESNAAVQQIAGNVSSIADTATSLRQLTAHFTV
jgi:methyl-accepting chemotaxis protein